MLGRLKMLIFNAPARRQPRNTSKFQYRHINTINSRAKRLIVALVVHDFIAPDSACWLVNRLGRYA